MPGVIDSHQHITMCVVNDLGSPYIEIEGSGKKECLEFIRKAVEAEPERTQFRFKLDKYLLQGEDLTYHALDEAAPNVQVVVMEGIGHSGWINSVVMRDYGITEDIKDSAPGLSYYQRDKDGKLTGFLVEFVFQEYNYKSTRHNVLIWYRTLMPRHFFQSAKMAETVFCGCLFSVFFSFEAAEIRETVRLG